MKNSVLIVDDNQAVLSALAQLLEYEVEKVIGIKSPGLIPGIIETQEIDVIIMDMNFSRGSTDGQEGITWLKRILQDDSDAVVLMITAYGEMDLAIEAMKSGATDFIAKPWDNDKLVATVRSGIMLKESRKKVRQLKSKQDHLSHYIDAGHEKLYGKSSEMYRVQETIRKVAPSDSNVLVLGENGTGKELIAREIHQASSRSNEVFVHVDLGAISESLFESELFGHTRGAFTDAKTDKAGRIEIASGGTLFLDEIGNLQPTMQTKLLNVLQNREIYRIGSNKPQAADFRLISATNQDLRAMISENLFREDLYYRINTIELTAPPLRERGQDIIDLANYFLEKYRAKHKRPGLRFSTGALDAIQRNQWPGNVRQLQHSVERAVLMADGRKIEAGDIFPGASERDSPDEIRRPTLAQLEEISIRDSIQRNGGNLSKAARELGVARSTLYNKMKSYGI
ncbi:MAG: sigma-54-dependent Fis family transcriptional regulator [Bacteroidetes bacterium]|nr:MAG: sigma-54-dependent Fis family transcriptional regulator [Bacteroidota bacterium]